MRTAAVAVVLCGLLAAPAHADRVVKRLRTSKAQVVEHIKTERSLGTGREGVVTSVTRWKCQGFHKSKSGKARTWRCTLWSGDCSSVYRLGKVRRVTDQGARYVVWWNEELKRLTCP